MGEMMQTFLTEESQGGAVKIAVDHREDEEFDRLLKKMGAVVSRVQLPVGDFICSSRLAVERKTRDDFEQSIIDGRLFTQLPLLVENYDRVVIIVEGKRSDRRRVKKASLMGAYASIIARYGASLLFTKDMLRTARVVFHFAKHEQVAKKQPMRIYAKKRTLTPSQTSRSIVETLPMIGPKLAKALLNHFGSAEAVLQATERELAEVPGMGKKKAKAIRDILSFEYDEDDDPTMY
jgi:Fanconi anemia group M protein